MGFFKKIGNSLKGVTKMISIKNIGKVVSGNVAGLGTELAGRLATPFVAKSTVQDVQASAPVQMLDTTLQAKTEIFSDNLAKKMGQTDTAQNLTSFATKAAIEAFWQKNKSWIKMVIGLLVALVAWFVGRRIFSGNSRKGGRR